MPDHARTQQPAIRTPAPEVSPATPAPPELSASKVIAGAGAAATTAVVGSFFGVTGTVVGAALGSVVSTVGAALYQRSLDRVRAQVRLPGGRAVPVTRAVEVPAPRTADDAEAAATRVVVQPLPAPDAGHDAVSAGAARPYGDRPRRRPGRTGLLVGVAAVLAFALGLMAVTGLEWLTGSTLADGQPGTSVGRVLDGNAPEPDPVPADDSDEFDGYGESDRSGRADGSAAPTETPAPEPTSPPADGPGPSMPPGPGDPTTTPTPTAHPPVDVLPDL